MKHKVDLGTRVSRCFALLCFVSSLGLAEEEPSSSQNTPEGSSVSPAAEALIKQLAVRSRRLDPFGLSIDPSVAATLEIEAPVAELQEEVAPKSSLEEALERLTITGVIPRRKAVIIGSRTLRTGEQFVIEKDTFVFKLRLSKVALDGITVTDLDSQESAFLPLGIAPSLRKGGPTFSPEQFQPRGSILTIK